MSQIPKPRLPEPPVDPRRDRVRFSFRHLHLRGSYSLKTYKDLPKSWRRSICSDFFRCARVTLLQFKSSNGVRLRTRTLPKRFRRPDALSEDVKDQLWQYFRLSRRDRAYGFLLGRTFFVVMIDPDHELGD